jgi:hypothetical protein
MKADTTTHPGSGYATQWPAKLSHAHRLHHAAGIDRTGKQRQQCWHMRRKEYMCNADATCCLHTRIQCKWPCTRSTSWRCSWHVNHRGASDPCASALLPTHHITLPYHKQQKRCVDGLCGYQQQKWSACAHTVQQLLLSEASSTHGNKQR